MGTVCAAVQMALRAVEIIEAMDAMRTWVRIAALTGLIVIAIGARAARADDPGVPAFSFSGFGTLGIVHSTEDKADFTSSAFKPNGAGYTRSWSADVDTLLGLQVTANPGPKISAVLQVVAEQGYDNSYRPHVEWANVRYQYSPELFIRAGRTVLPFLLVSDSQKVGYANPWVRPPLEVYRLTAVTFNDGVDAGVRIPYGTAIHTLLVTAGQSDTRFPNGDTDFGTARSREVLGFVHTMEQGFATLRLNFGQSRVSIDAFAPLFDAFRQFGPEGIAIADKYDVNRRRVRFFGLGGSYDPGPWFVMAEARTLLGDSVLGKRWAWYVSGGHRIGKFTPYFTYARANADNLTDPGLTVASLPDFLAGPALELNAALNSTLATKPVQQTLSLGMRWDFRKNAALKLQLDHTRIGAGSTGILSNTQPDFRSGGKLNVFSATLDLVF